METAPADSRYRSSAVKNLRRAHQTFPSPNSASEPVRATESPCLFTDRFIRGFYDDKDRSYWCPICNDRAYAAKVMLQHVQTCCRKARLRGKKACPACQPLSKAHEAKHQVHDKTLGPCATPNEGSYLTGKNERSLTRCQECNSYVRADRMSKHLVKVHCQREKTRVGRPTITKSAPSRSTPSEIVKMSIERSLLGDEIRRGRREYRQPQRSLDATSLYSSRYRENGRFGSHPAYDAFDDESNAD
jgi:hypothetical protein